MKQPFNMQGIGIPFFSATEWERARAVVENRDFLGRSYREFIAKVEGSVCNKRVVESLIKAGAFDFLTKPVDLGRLRELVATALRLRSGENPGPLSIADFIERAKMDIANKV